jgi:hypothetical protein
MKKVFLYLGISMTLSFVVAITFVVVETLSLPKTDLAYGLMPFQNHLMLFFMVIIAISSGFVFWLLSLLLGWHTPIKTLVTLTSIPTLIFTVIATPFNPAIGWFGSYIVCLIALIYCKLNYNKKISP